MINSNKYIRMALFFLLLTTFTFPSLATRGIYLTQYSLENTAFINNIIKHAKASNIDTFIIDMELPSKRYRENIALVKQNGIKYVARIVMFDGGAKPGELMNQTIWEKRYTLVKQAVEWGADEIQLDYIRYSAKQKSSSQNSRDVLQVIAWFKNKLISQNIPLQIDVFGIASFGEAKYIGQNIKLFAETVDAICPMVYPSHYSPYAEHYAKPYDTIFDSLERIKKQFGGKMPMKLIPYIELSNYHYPNMTRDKKIAYIKAEIKAVKDAGADGWYAWSPHNRYDNLFAILEGNEAEVESNDDANKQTAPAQASIKQELTTAAQNLQKPEEPKKSTGYSWLQQRFSFLAH